MAKTTWREKREEIQGKIAKAVKECYAEFIREGGNPKQCAGCPLGIECERYNKKVCLQRFAEGVVFGYQRRIFEAIDAKVQSIEDKVVGNGEVKSYVNGLKSAKTIIQQLD